MSVPLYANFKALLPWAIVGLLAPGVEAVSQIGLACARTPAQAVNANRVSTAIESSRTELGYRVAAVHWDPLLRQRWATVVSCGHPELPSFAILMPDRKEDHMGAMPSLRNSQSAGAASFPIVRAGDLVYLWSVDHNLRIEVSGIAEDSGSKGDFVRVRLRHSGLDGQQPQHILSGVVRAPREVEMQR